MPRTSAFHSFARLMTAASRAELKVAPLTTLPERSLGSPSYLSGFAFDLAASTI